MKNLFPFLLAAALLCSCQPKNTLTVRGTVTNAGETTDVALMQYSDEMGFVRVDSAALSPQGAFTLKLAEATTGKYLLMAGDIDEGGHFAYKEFFGAPGHTVRITGEFDALGAAAVESDIPEQIEQNRFEDAVREQRRQLEKLAFRGEMEANLSIVERLRWQQDSITLDVIAQNPHTDKALEELAMVTFSIGAYPNMPSLRPRIEAVYGQLTPEEQASPNGKELQTVLFLPWAEAGGPVIDADLLDLQGATHRLAEYAGKYLLLDFWASWCGPCIATFPELRAFAEKYTDEVVVIGINIDENQAYWVTASQEHNVTWTNLHAGVESPLPRQYGVTAIPHVVLVSPEGIILKNGWRYRRGDLDGEFARVKEER